MPNQTEQTVRERILSEQEQYLSPYATIRTRGRQQPQPPCEFRTEFRRDRDRIIHSSAFRRLMHKTQVFLSPRSEHLRTRLTHTLEVSQIACTISRALSLNEDLTDAIALGHDLGHTPFGHDGEGVLDDLMRDCAAIGAGSPHDYGHNHGYGYGQDDEQNFDYDLGPNTIAGFHHNEQSVRVVDILTRNNSGRRGLNLTYEVRDGIRNHRGHTKAATLEGEVVRYADKIAYLNHDTEDAEKAGIIVDGKPFTQDRLQTLVLNTLGRTKSARITTLVGSLVHNSDPANGVITYGGDVAEAHQVLRDFMYGNIYNNAALAPERDKAKDVVRLLFRRFVTNPTQMPEFYQGLCDRWGVARAAADYVAGMTDSYALDAFKDFVLPKRF